MTRIFTTLASLTGMALVAAFGFGLASWLRSSSQNPADSLYLVHFILGLFSSIGTLLVHCMIFTYFLGTGRWVKEVKLAYDLPDAPLPLLTRELKRKTFPPALIAMLVTIATSAAGAGVQLREWPWPVHGSLAVATLVINLWAFRIEYGHVRTNKRVIEEVMREVDRIRAGRGLPSNSQALEDDV